MTITQPHPREFNPFYAGYVGKVPATGPVALMTDQIAAFEKFRALSDTQGNHRYADGKWTVKEVLGHMSDAERVFGYRLLRIARHDQTPLAGFDENAWAAVAPHGTRRLPAVVDELVAVRRSTLALIETLTEAELSGTALANNNPVSGRALCWIIPGHAQHHLDVLRDRYSVPV
jgi:uncharacterized damage-inducible protein DinB